jgi:hypothetical protein
MEGFRARMLSREDAIAFLGRFKHLTILCKTFVCYYHTLSAGGASVFLSELSRAGLFFDTIQFGICYYNIRRFDWELGDPLQLNLAWRLDLQLSSTNLPDFRGYEAVQRAEASRLELLKISPHLPSDDGIRMRHCLTKVDASVYLRKEDPKVTAQSRHWTKGEVMRVFPVGTLSETKRRPQFGPNSVRTRGTHSGVRRTR